MMSYHNPMLDEPAIRRLSQQLGVRTDYTEQDYINTWGLSAIYSTDFGENLLFKGGLRSYLFRKDNRSEIDADG